MMMIIDASAMLAVTVAHMTTSMPVNWYGSMQPRQVGSVSPEFGDKYNIGPMSAHDAAKATTVNHT
jgi:hypothetical protein